MKTINTLLMSLVMSTVLFAQNSSVCKIDGESAPEWICNTKSTDKSTTAVGSGNSSLEAISAALVKIGFNNNTELGQTYKKADSKKSEAEVTKQVIKTLYGKNIEIQANSEKFTRTVENNIESITTYVSKLSVGIDKKDDKLFILKVFKKEISTKKKGTSDKPVITVEYHMDIVSNENLNIVQELEKAGIKILKTYTTPQLKQYVLLQVNKER